MPFKCSLETQNLRPPEEKELTFSAYGYQGTEVMGVNMETGKVVNYSNAPNQYDEPEGIFPDGKHTLVECDRHSGKVSGHIDLYKLALDGPGRDLLQRLPRLQGIESGGERRRPLHRLPACQEQRGGRWRRPLTKPEPASDS